MAKPLCQRYRYPGSELKGFRKAAAVAKLHSDPVFCAALEAARKEYKYAVAKSLMPSRNCEEEAEALAIW